MTLSACEESYPSEGPEFLHPLGTYFSTIIRRAYLAASILEADSSDYNIQICLRKMQSWRSKMLGNRGVSDQRALKESPCTLIGMRIHGIASPIRSLQLYLFSCQSDLTGITWSLFMPFQHRFPLHAHSSSRELSHLDAHLLHLSVQALPLTPIS